MNHLLEDALFQSLNMGVIDGKILMMYFKRLFLSLYRWKLILILCIVLLPVVTLDIGFTLLRLVIFRPLLDSCVTLGIKSFVSFLKKLDSLLILNIILLPNYIRLWRLLEKHYFARLLLFPGNFDKL